MTADKDYDFLIVGAGFSGLTLGLKLAEAGKSVVILESENAVGGLASDFYLSNGSRLERFYHHWFRHDTDITKLVSDLGLLEDVREYPSQTGMYFNKKVWSLSSPVDLLRFGAISLLDRIRLGITILFVRQQKNWSKIESKSIREWLEPLCGPRAYKIVWEPLVTAKFSKFSEDVSAAWMWKKLVLRGSTRGKSGSESLLYIDGGFGKLAEEMVRRITLLHGRVFCGKKVSHFATSGTKVVEVRTDSGDVFRPKQVIFTGAPSQLNEVMPSHEFSDWSKELEAVDYLANICLVLLLNRSLSDTYWMNVNDPGFPFVGVIEHTNLVSQSRYGNLRVVYLSRYIAIDHADYALPDNLYFLESLAALKLMFPEFAEDWIEEYYIWRSPFAQPITTKNYSKTMPQVKTPFDNLFLNCMAQIYPEDRGTNYAVKNSVALAETLLQDSEGKV
jgi:protoporphyrinogen oxidase